MEEELNYSHEQIADRVKKERASITNYIRLLKLPPNIIDAIKQGKISFGHGRAIINLVDQEVQMYVFKQIIEQELSVRKTEALVKRMNIQKKPSGNPVKTSENPYRKIEDLISSEYGTKARIINKNGKGNITLEFFSIDELNGLLEKLNIKVS
jgi:ParB family chromosome partitioning protein